MLSVHNVANTHGHIAAQNIYASSHGPCTAKPGHVQGAHELDLMRYRSLIEFAILKAVGFRAKATLYGLIDLVLPDQHSTNTTRHCAMGFIL